jgi:hypothetical protein
MKNLIKYALIAVALYGGYQLLKSFNEEKEIPEITEEKDEEVYVQELIDELKNRPNKTKKDKYNIELLEVKLNQIKNKK